MKLRVKENPSLYRDSFSKGIISEDHDAYQKYLKEKNLRDKNSKFESEINNMKSDINEIKSLLRELLNK